MKNKKIIFAAFMSFLLILFISLSFVKKGTFVDELLTYDLSNRQAPQVKFLMDYIKETSPKTIYNDISDILENGKNDSQIYKDFNDFKSQYTENSLWHDSQYFSNYIQVEEGSRFDFLSVYYNSIYDSSPPLYYTLIHFVCSLFPDSFSLWYGLSINILFLLLTCALMYKLVQKYFGGTKYALLAVLCYALSIGGISTLMILRMYAIYTFFTLAFFAVSLMLAENDFIFTRKIRNLYIPVTALVFLTQYYFAIYACFMAAVVIIYHICQKEYRKIFPYIKFSVMSFLISLVIWPFSIKHIFLDSFGASTFSAAASGNSLHKLKEYLLILVKNLFADNLIFFSVFCILFVTGIILLISDLKRKETGFNLLRAAMLLFPVIGYIILVALSAPFISDRYIMCTFPLIIIGIYCFLRRIISCISSKNAFPILCVIGLFITVIGLTTVDWNYTFGHMTERAEIMTEADNTICIYVTADGDGWQYKSCLDLLAACKKTALLYPSQLPELSLDLPASSQYEQILLCITSSLDQEKIINEISDICDLAGMSIQSLPQVNDDYASMYLLYEE